MLGESVGAEALRISAANVQVNFIAPAMDMTDLVNLTPVSEIRVGQHQLLRGGSLSAK
jgi:hypothetical protein